MRPHFNNKLFYKIFVVGIVLAIICMSTMAAAAEREIIADGEYIMGDGETMAVAEQRAQKNAVREAAEEAGAYVRSYTKTRDMVVEEDTIEVIADHVMKISVLSKKREMVGDAVHFTVRIKAVFSENDIEKNLARLAEDRGAAVAYQDLKKAFNQQAKELEALKRQLTVASGGEKKTVLNKISKNEQRFRATLAVEKGSKQLTALNFYGAEASFSRAIELDPSLAEAYAGRAETRLFYGAALLSDADRAISLQPDNARFYALRARVRASQHCTKANRDGCEAVFSDLEKAARLDPKNPVYPVMQGKMYSEIGQSERAVQEYERAVKILPSVTMPLVAVNTYLQRADFFLEQGQPGYLQKALSNLDRAIEIITGPAYLNEGTQKFARLIRQQPRSEEDASRLLKDIFGIDDVAKLSQEEKAAWGKRYKQAVKVLNDVSQVYWKRAQVRYEAGDVAGAEKDRQAACNACEIPENGIVDASSHIVVDGDFCKPERAYHPFPSKDALAAYQSLKLGQRAYGKNHREMSINYLSRAVTLDPRLAEAYIQRGRAYMYFDPVDCDRAIADFSKAVEIDPDNDQALFERGLVYLKLGTDRNETRDIDEARRYWAAAAADFTRILTLKDSDYKSEARIKRARAYEWMKRYDFAAKDYAAEIEATGSYEYFLNQAHALKLAGNRDAAIKAIDEYLAAARADLKAKGETGDSDLSDKIANAKALKKELAGHRR